MLLPKIIKLETMLFFFFLENANIKRLNQANVIIDHYIK